MTKKLTIMVILAFALSVVAGAVSAQANEAKILKDKVLKAAKYLSKKGPDGLAEFSDTNSDWAKTPYIFVYDLKGTIIAHGANPKLVGKNLMGLKDVKGNMFAAEFVAVAKDPGQGWVEYWWPKKGSKTPEQKASYIKRVPGQDMLVGAGLNNYSKAKAIQEAGN